MNIEEYISILLFLQKRDVVYSFTVSKTKITVRIKIKIGAFFKGMHQFLLQKTTITANKD